MQIDFHYYATYCAAYLAGYTHEEAQQLCYAAQLVDCCTVTMLKRVDGPKAAATTQLQLELADARTDPAGLQNITRIWSSFHFLPFDLYARKEKRCSRRYLNKYRLICDVNSDLLTDTVELAKGGSLQAAGIAMHVLADTWAHRYFAGTPSFVINNAVSFRNLDTKEQIRFTHNPKAEDDIETGKYTNSVYQSSESSIMNLGHGRAGHLPDYSFMRYSFVPAWAGFEVIKKDNPQEYYSAFAQMVCALKYLRGHRETLEKDTYDTESVGKYREVIMKILSTPQLDASKDWKAFGEGLSKRAIEDFDESRYEEEYMAAAEDAREDTYLGRFFLAAMAQKSMVTSRIFRSKNRLAGVSIDFDAKGFKGIKDFRKLVEAERKLPQEPGKEGGHEQR